MSKSDVLNVIRKVTIIAKVLPFALVVASLLSQILYLLDNEKLSALLDVTCYSSPFVVLTLLVLSKVLKLCVWHKAECVILLISTCIFFVDSFIAKLDIVAEYVNLGSVIFLFVASLFNGYNLIRYEHKKK